MFEYAFIIGLFLSFPEPRIGLHVVTEAEHQTVDEQRCRAGCLLNFQIDGWTPALEECDAECEGYDGEAG